MVFDMVDWVFSLCYFDGVFVYGFYFRIFFMFFLCLVVMFLGDFIEVKFLMVVCIMFIGLVEL